MSATYTGQMTKRMKTAQTRVPSGTDPASSPIFHSRKLKLNLTPTTTSCSAIKSSPTFPSALASQALKYPPSAMLVTTEQIRKYDRAREIPSSSSPGPTRDARTPVVESDCRSSSGKDSVLLNAVTETTHLSKPKAAATILPIAIERMVYSAAHTVQSMH